MTNPDTFGESDSMHDADRFAFISRRIHSFATTGNAYDATQCDDTIKSGDTLLVLSERVIGIAFTWPFAVTKEAGKLHQLKPTPGDTLAELTNQFSICEAAILEACQLAHALQFELDPGLAEILAASDALKGIA